MTQSETPLIPDKPRITLQNIAAAWLPLAVSWLLMSVEGPANSAIVARLADPEIHLAAWGGIVYPISLLMESPVVMMLSASTALSKNWDAYKKLRRFMLVLGAFLTLIHGILAFTPIYYWVTGKIINAPGAIIKPGRIGLMIMMPWAMAIGYRRLHQGVMIRHGYSNAVGVGTVIRLLTNAICLATGYLLKVVPGIVVASSAVSLGVVAEAVYAGVRARPIIKTHIMTVGQKDSRLSLLGFLEFYIPLAATTMITFFVSPLGSAAMSRMPNSLASLAVWPVLYGLIFMLRSPCLAFNEVVIAWVERPQSFQHLRRFAQLLAIGSTLITLTLVASPLANLCLGTVMHLPPVLMQISRTGLWIGLFIPFFVLLQNWYQGIIVSSHETRSVTEAVIIYITTVGFILFLGVKAQSITGLFVTIAAYEVAGLTQSVWLWRRSRPVVKHMTS